GGAVRRRQRHLHAGAGPGALPGALLDARRRRGIHRRGRGAGDRRRGGDRARGGPLQTRAARAPATVAGRHRAGGELLMRTLIWLALLCAGCPTSKDTRYCDAVTPCTDPAFPACDMVKHESEPGGGSNGGGGPLVMSMVACSDSSTCPAAMPVCSMGLCGQCNGDSSACVSFHAATPVGG